MIWHFLEVWVLLAIAFAAGCAVGAWLYGVIGASALATTQGAIADEVGDVVDRIKTRLGVGPAWRHDQLVAVERPAPAMVPDVPAVEERIEPTLETEPVVVKHHEVAAHVPALAATADVEEVPVEGDPAREAGVGHVADDGVVPKRPAGLGGPRGGVPDNLTRIKGIGVRNETLLNSLGIYHFGQIASWTPGEMRWIGQYLAFPERIERDDWIGQAIALASGTETGFTKSAERRRQRRRQKQQAFAARQAAMAAADAPPQKSILVQDAPAPYDTPEDGAEADDVEPVPVAESLPAEPDDAAAAAVDFEEAPVEAERAEDTGDGEVADPAGR
jgi:NADH-quinone oxidoreductase subunit E